MIIEKATQLITDRINSCFLLIFNNNKNKNYPPITSAHRYRSAIASN